MQIPAILVNAASHREVRGRDLSVLVFLCEILDSSDFRPLKPWYVAERLQMHRTHVHRSVTHLLSLKYLEQGKKIGNAYTFRLSCPSNANTGDCTTVAHTGVRSAVG